MPEPLCFVLMPFAKKPDGHGVLIDFDAMYRDVIAPAIRSAGLAPLRADEEMTGGIIHKPMFERLILCEFAVADLTTANANVFYELGVRHAVRPWSTVIMFAESDRLPFDVALLRGIPYAVARSGAVAKPDDLRSELQRRLNAARQAAAAAARGDVDSPIYQLVEGFPDIARLKTDVFRDRVDYAARVKEQLAVARSAGAAAVHEVEKQVGALEDVESGVLIDLFLSYRAVKEWPAMISLAERMPKPLAATVMVQEQLALALNRNGEADRAERVLTALLTSRGPSSETYGILGRIYKDRWEAAHKKGDNVRAAAFLEKAINAYLKGFETDWRDAYPGVNAVTLMELKEPPDERGATILPVVTYAVQRRIATGNPDYWDHATLLELAVLRRDQQAANAALGAALIAVREKWEPETTLRNLRLIDEARQRRGSADAWLRPILEALSEAAA